MDIVIGRVPVPNAGSDDWEEAFRRRVRAAADHEGWLGVDLCLPADEPNSRVIIGRWTSKANYDAWVRSPSYLGSVEETRELQTGVPITSWYSVVWSLAPSA